MDWWPNLAGKCVTVIVLIFPILYIFSTNYIYIFKFTVQLQPIVFFSWNWSLIKPLWFFDQIPEPTIYKMVNGEHAQ